MMEHMLHEPAVSPPVDRDTTPAIAVGGRLLQQCIPWFAVMGVCALVFTADLVGVETGVTASADRSTELGIHHAFANASFRVFEAISTLGGGTVRTALVVVGVVGLALSRRFLGAVLLVVAPLGAALLWPVAKSLVARPRPHLFADAQVTGGYSFPSGHATDTIAFCGALAFILWHVIPRRDTRFAIVAIAVVAILLVGLSRIVLGVHYPTDVIAGYALGGAWLAGTIGTSIAVSTWGRSPTVRRHACSRGSTCGRAAD